MSVLDDVFSSDATERYASAVYLARQWQRPVSVGNAAILPDGSIWRDGVMLLPPQRFQVVVMRHRHTQRRYVVRRERQPWLAAYVATDEAAAPYLAGQSLPSDAALGEAIRATRHGYDEVG